MVAVVVSRRGGGRTALASRGLLGGHGGGGVDVAAVHLDAAQPLPVAPLQEQVALRRRSAAAAAAAGGAPRVVVIPRLLLHCRTRARPARVTATKKKKKRKKKHRNSAAEGKEERFMVGREIARISIRLE